MLSIVFLTFENKNRKINQNTCITLSVSYSIHMYLGDEVKSILSCCAYSGTPLEWLGNLTHKSCKIWSISTHHSLQIMFILPLLTGHLIWKATILGVLLYFSIPAWDQHSKSSRYTGRVCPEYRLSPLLWRVFIISDLYDCFRHADHRWDSG